MHAVGGIAHDSLILLHRVVRKIFLPELSGCPPRGCPLRRLLQTGTLVGDACAPLFPSDGQVVPKGVPMSGGKQGGARTSANIIHPLAALVEKMAHAEARTDQRLAKINPTTHTLPGRGNEVGTGETGE